MSHFGSTDVILESLNDREKPNGKPRVRPLRALVHKLIGPVIDESVNIVACSPGYAAVTCRMTVEVVHPEFYDNPENEHATFGLNSHVTVSSCADVSVENASDDFAKYALAFADTRVKGRCYVELLGLDVVTSEEIGGQTSNNNEEYEPTTRPDVADIDREDVLERRCYQISKKHNVHLTKEHVLVYFRGILKNPELDFDNIELKQWHDILPITRNWLDGKLDKGIIEIMKAMPPQEKE